MSRLFTEIRWILQVALGVFLLMALVSYSRHDPSWTHAAQVDQIANWAGRVGAWTADILLLLFGLSAYWWVVLLVRQIIANYRRITNHEAADADEAPSKDRTWLAEAFAFVLVLAASDGLEALRMWSLKVQMPRQYASGGVVGEAVAHGVSHALGFTGATLFLLVALAIGLSLYFNFSWLSVCEKTGDAIMADIDLIDTSGTVIGEITGFGMRALPADVSGAILAESPAPVSRQPTFRAGPGLDPDTGVRLLLDLLSSATAPVVAVRPFLDGQPVPLAGTERPTEPGAASGADPGEAAPTLPDLSHGSHPQLATTGAPEEAAPADARGVAAKMRAIWEETLEITDFGDDTDFYELGGTSLSAIELVNRIRDELSVDLSIVVLLEAPTLAGMAAAVQAGHAA